MVTGICYMCDTIKDVAAVAHQHATDNTEVKLGKVAGVWYCVVKFVK